MPNEADDTVKAAVQESNKKKKRKHNERLNENTHRADFVDARPLCPDELKSKTVFVEKDVEKSTRPPFGHLWTSIVSTWSLSAWMLIVSSLPTPLPLAIALPRLPR